MEENIGFKKEIFASEQKSNYDQEALKSLCQQVLDNHNELKSKLKASTDIENDCQFVLPKLLGQVMKLSNGKANSTQAKEAFSELLGNHLINMLLKIRANLCFLYIMLFIYWLLNSQYQIEK